MAGPSRESQSYLFFLPDEIVQHIINCLVDRLITNNKTGHPHPYYAPNYRHSQKERRRTLVSLCLSSRKLNAIATPFLYRDVFLNKQPRDFALPTDSPVEVEGCNEGIILLGLFLRTMMERPELRTHVSKLDCWFHLAPLLDYEETPVPWSVFRAKYICEFNFLKECVSYAHSENDLSILAHVGLSSDELPRSLDVAERAFAAILLLTTELRTVAFPPPPEITWCLLDVDEVADVDGDRSFAPYKYSGYYDVLSTLLDQAYQDEGLSPTTLQNLESVRFTFVPNIVPVNSRARRYSSDPDPSLPANPGYTFQIDACLGILRAPKVIELESDADNGLGAVLIHSHAALSRLNLQRAFFSSSRWGQDILKEACNYWPLTALMIQGANEAGYETLSDSSSDISVPDIDVWNMSLGKVANTLKILDIGSDYSPWMPLQHLSCLHTLVALEHLRIGLPLLSTNEGFITRPLWNVLPPNLKTLTINDAYAANHYASFYGQEESWDETGARFKEGPRRYRRLLSSALYRFAGVCGKTHPKLRSVMVLGEPPIQGPRYIDKVRAMELAGPQLGQVVVNAGRVRDLFAQFDVKLQEFFHGQEPEYPFRVVQVARYT